MSGERENVPVAPTGSNQGVGFTYNELLAELGREYEAAHPKRKPGGITAKELSNQTGDGVNSCKIWLDEQVKAGQLRMEECVNNGKRTAVYYRLA